MQPTSSNASETRTQVTRTQGPFTFGLAAAAACALVGTFALSSASAQKAPAPTPLELPLSIKVGQQFSLTATTEEEKFRSGRLSLHALRSSTYDLSVDKREADRFVMTMTLRASSAKLIKDPTGRGAAQVAMANALLKALKAVPARFEVSGKGQLLRVLDWDTWSQKMADATQQAILAAVKARGTGDKALPPAAVSFATTFVKKAIKGHNEKSGLALLRPLPLMFGIQGITLTPGKPLTQNREQFNPIGKRKLKTVRTITLAPRKPDATEARVAWTTSYDGEALKAASLNLVLSAIENAKVSKEELKAVKQRFIQGFKRIVFEHTDNGEASLALGDGWVRSLTVKSTLKSGPAGKLQTANRKRVTVTLTPKS